MPLKRLPALPAEVDVVCAGGVTVDVKGVGIGVVVDIPPDEDGRLDLVLVSLSRIQDSIITRYKVQCSSCCRFVISTQICDLQ